MAAFDPARDGFAFANNWTLTDAQRTEMSTRMVEALAAASAVLLPPFPSALIILRVASRLARTVAASVPDSYGLCGGMAFASLDYRLARREVPLSQLYAQRPLAGSALHMYLWQRLLDSLALNAPTFLVWIAMLHLVPSIAPFNGGSGWLLARTRAQLDELRCRLADGDPVPIGLVGESRDPFMDHQVLAYDLQSAEPQQARISVYDMNCPGLPQTIDLDLRGRDVLATETCPGRRGRLRGFFCETYVRATPP